MWSIPQAPLDDKRSTCCSFPYKRGRLSTRFYGIHGSKSNKAFYLPTVRSFCELTRYLLGFEMAKTPYLLSEHFSQDPIENYFGQQRSRGGWSQILTVQACLISAQSLRVQGSQAMMPLRGNSRRKKRLFKDKEEVIDDKPLPKRPRRK